jgi:pyruvate ferredoxin oxidoreductase gamma subunit
VTAPTFAIRLHGRGGQGVVTAAELLSVAAFLDGHEAQAFPSFGSERMGAPVTSFCRIADRPIRTHEPVSAPDAVIVADATLLQHIDVFAGLAEDGYAVINSVRTPAGLGLDHVLHRLGPERVRCVPATDLARTHLGRPLPNVCLLGAFAALTGRVGRTSLEQAVRERFPGALAAGNVAALGAAFDDLGTARHA